jgi:hypothetical protein
MHLNVIRERLKPLSIALAMCLMLSLAVGSVSAAVTYTPSNSNGWVTIVGDGQVNTATNYTVHVEHPYALGLDADYWNITVYVERGAGLGTSHINYYTHVHIYDGATNLTENNTLAAVDDARAYGNASYDSTAIGTMIKNDSATYTVELYLSTGVKLASYTGQVSVMNSELASGLVNALMLIIPMIIIVMIIGWIGNLTGKIGSKSRRK